METNCTSALLRASIRLSPDFTLPRARSPGFGFHPSDSRPFQTPPLTAYTVAGMSVSLRFRGWTP